MTSNLTSNVQSLPLTAQQRRQRVLAFKTATLEAARSVQVALRQRLNDVERFKFVKSSHYVTSDSESGVGDSSQQLRSENENARQLKNPVPPNFAKYSQIVQSNASTNNNAVVRSSKDSMDGQQILGSGANSSNSTIPTVTASPAPFNISGRGVEIGKATSSVHCDPTCSQSEGDMESSLYPTDSESYFPYSGPPLPQQQQQQQEQLQQSEGMHELSLQQRGGVDGFVTDMSSCPSDLFDNNSTTAAAMNGKSLNVSKPARGKKPITPDVSGRTVAAFDERNSYVGVASFESQSIGMQRSTSTGAMHTQIEQAADNQPMLSSSSQPRDSSSQFLARLAAQSSSSAIVKPKPAKRRVSESKLGVSSGIPNAISIEVQQQEQRQQQQQQNSGVPFADGSQIRASSGVQSAELKRTSLLYQHNQLQLQHSRCFTVESGSNRDDSSQKPRTVSVLHRDLLLKDSLSSAVAARQRNLVHPASVGRTDTEATTAVSAFAIRQQHQQQQQSFMHTVGHPLSDETDEERSLTDDVEAGTEKRRVRAITDRRSALLARLHELQTSKHTSRSVPPTSFLICSRKVLGSQKTKTDAKTPSSALTLTDISFESHDNTDAESFEEVLPIAESVHLTDRVFSKPKSHWDYLLEEAQWLAVDFKQELRWKLAASKAVAQTCCLRAPRLLPPEKKRKFGIPKFVADSVLTESVGAAAASASKDIVQSSERDTSRPSSTSKLGPDAEIDAVGTVRGSVQMEIESPGAACKVLVASAPDDTVINPATAPVAAASLVTSAEQSDGCDYRRAVAGKISQSVEEFWRELHTDCAGAHVAEGVSLRPLWDMRELFEGPSANSALRSVMPQLQTDLARVCSTLETATAHSDVHEVVKKLISLSPDRIGSEIGDSGRSYLLQHQKESFDRVCSLNASQFGAFLYGPQFAGKSILSMMLLNRWIGEQVHGDASGGPLPIALVFTFRQRELKWLNHWEQLTSPKDGESKATNLKAVVPMLWSDIQSDETRLKCAEEGLGASVLIVAFEDYDNFFGHFLVEGKEEMGAKMSSSHLLLGRACGIIVDGCFTDLIGRDTSLYFADGAVVRCSGTSESVSADFPSAPMRAVSCVAIVLELLAKHTPAQMRNRCLLSAHSLFSDCFDFFSALAFLSPGQSRSAWRRHFSHARKGAAIADAVAVASIKNVIDEIGCGGTETFSFGTLKIGQENRNILSQIATNLSAVIDLPRPSSVKESQLIVEEVVMEPMSGPQAVKYSILEKAFFADSAAISGESAIKLAHSLVILRSACLHPSLLTISIDSCGDKQQQQQQQPGGSPSSAQQRLHGGACSVSGRNPFNKAVRSAFDQLRPSTVPRHSAGEDMPEPFSDTLYSDSCKLRALVRLLRARGDARVVVVVESLFELILVHKFLNSLRTPHILAGDALQAFEPSAESVLPGRGSVTSNARELDRPNKAQIGSKKSNFGSGSTLLSEPTLSDTLQWLIAQKAIQEFNDSAPAPRVLLARAQVFSALSLNPVSADEVIVLSECWAFRRNASRRSVKNSFVLPLLAQHSVNEPCADSCVRRKIRILHVVAAKSLEESLASSGKTILHFQGKLPAELSQQSAGSPCTILPPESRLGQQASVVAHSDGRSYIGKVVNGGATFVERVDVEKLQQRRVFDRVPLYINNEPVEDPNEMTTSATACSDAADEFTANTTANRTPQSKHAEADVPHAHRRTKVGRGKGMIALSTNGQTIFVQNRSLTGSSHEDKAAEALRNVNDHDQNSSRTRANIMTVLQQLRNFDVLSDEAYMGMALDSDAKNWLHEFTMELNNFEKVFFVAPNAITFEREQLDVVSLGADVAGPGEAFLSHRSRSGSRLLKRRRSSDPVIRIYPANVNVQRVLHADASFTDAAMPSHIRCQPSIDVASGTLLQQGRPQLQQLDKTLPSSYDLPRYIWRLLRGRAFRVCYTNFLSRVFKQLHGNDSEERNFACSNINLVAKSILFLWSGVLNDAAQECTLSFNAEEHPSFSEDEVMKMRSFGLGYSEPEARLKSFYFQRAPVNGTGQCGAALMDCTDSQGCGNEGQPNTISKQSLIELERFRSHGGTLNGSQIAFTNYSSWPKFIPRFLELRRLFRSNGAVVDENLFVNPLTTAHVANIHFDTIPSLHCSNSIQRITDADELHCSVQVIILKACASRVQGNKNIAASGSATHSAAAARKNVSKSQTTSSSISGNWIGDDWSRADVGKDGLATAFHDDVRTGASNSSKKRSLNISGKNKTKNAKRPKTQDMHVDSNVKGTATMDSTSQARGVISDAANSVGRGVNSTSVATLLQSSSSSAALATAVTSQVRADGTEQPSQEVGFVEWRPAEDDIIICMQNSINDPDFTHTENWLNQPRQASLNATAALTARKRTAEEARRRYDELCRSGQKDARLKDRNIQNVIQKLKLSKKK